MPVTKPDQSKHYVVCAKNVFLNFKHNYDFLNFLETIEKEMFIAVTWNQFRFIAIQLGLKIQNGKLGY